MLLVITVASQIWGIWGVILGPPLVALIKDLTVYFTEQWNLDRRPIATQEEPPVSHHSFIAAPEAQRPSEGATSEEETSELSDWPPWH